ncbi:hypothetical protein B296_00030521, partial [Ensete ventricosum]
DLYVQQDTHHRPQVWTINATWIRSRDDTSSIIFARWPFPKVTALKSSRTPPVKYTSGSHAGRAVDPPNREAEEGAGRAREASVVSENEVKWWHISRELML